MGAIQDLADDNEKTMRRVFEILLTERTTETIDYQLKLLHDLAHERSMALKFAAIGREPIPSNVTGVIVDAAPSGGDHG